MTSKLLPYLISLLAATDTLWRPGRRDVVGNDQAVAICERRNQFFKYGMPFQLGGGDDASRKSAERVASELEKLPDVIFRRRKNKRVFWRLSDQGDWRLRSRCGSFGVSSMLTVMAALRCHMQDVPHEPDDNIVCETWLAGVDGTGSTDRLFDLECILYPALCRGWVTSNSDLDGRVAYLLTEAGREALDHLDDVDLPPYDQAAVDLYFDALLVAREELQAAKPERRNAIAPRLSNGLWPEDSDAAPIPPIFTKAGRVRSLASMKNAIAKMKL